MWFYCDGRVGKSGWFQKDRNAPCFNWNWPYTPSGMVKWQYRKPSKNYSGWTYIYFGETKEEICSRVNEFSIRKIEEYKIQIARLESGLLKP
jgi:hypothetical protein